MTDWRKNDKFKDTLQTLKNDKKEIQDKIKTIHDKKIHWKNAATKGGEEAGISNAEMAELNSQMAAKDATHHDTHNKCLTLYGEFVEQSATAPFVYLGRDANRYHLMHVTYRTRKQDTAGI